MKRTWCSPALILVTLPVLAASPPGVAPANPALHPLPTATPHAVQPVGAAGSAIPRGNGPPATAQQRVGTSMHTILSTPQHSPDRLDFGEIWDGQSSMRTLSLTTTAAGYLRAEIPSGPFRVVEIRELGPPRAGSSKNNPGSLQPMVVQETKGKVTFHEDQPGPWTYGAVAAGDQVLIHVVFKPRFDLGTMMAGPKSANMRVGGPGPMGAWTLSTPLAGMFNGKHTTPLVILPKKEFWQVSVGTTERLATFVVRLVGTGEAVSGRLVWPSAAQGLRLNPYGPINLGATETKELTVPVSGTGGHDDTTPLDGTVAFEFSRRGESLTQQTPPLSFRVIFFPDRFGKQLANTTCNGVALTLASFAVYLDNTFTNGRASFGFNMGPCKYAFGGHDVQVEVSFPQAGRTLFHTTVPCNSFPQIVSRVEEGGPTVLGSVNQSWNVSVGAGINVGAPESLDRYRALMHSPAQLRCW